MDSSVPALPAEQKLSAQTSWYRKYSVAMLESSRVKVFDRIESARKAIQDRVAELRFRVPANDREREDLKNALGHLSNLLQTISGETKGILWD
jgi:hypothetical protein